MLEKTIKTIDGDDLCFSTGFNDYGTDVYRSLTIFRTRAGQDRRRKVFGCRLDLDQWRKFADWLHLT